MPVGQLSAKARVRVVQKALTLVSEKKPTWTRHELVRQLALVMPAQTRHMTPDAAQDLLAGLADEALSGDIGDVVCLEAPEWPPLPGSLRRELDGRSIYTRPGTTRYATAAQLSAEEHSSPTPRHREHRACRASWQPGSSAPTQGCWKRSYANARTTHAARSRGVGCGWTRPPPSTTS